MRATTTKIVHEAVPGRLRFRVRGIHHDPARANALAEALGRSPAIVRVRASAWTASVLIVHRPDTDAGGLRILIDELLGERRPPGHPYEPRSHFAVAAAVAQKRADWGVTIETVAREKGLRFRPVRDESYDFAVPADRWERPAVAALRRALEPGSRVRRALAEHGFRPPEA